MTAKKKPAHSRKRSRPIEPKRTKINKNIIIVVIIAAIIVIAIGLFILSGDQESAENPVAVIETSMGTIKVELFKDKVPNTVKNFIEYANDGFYEGLVFHRVIDGFMIQGGGFLPDGTQKNTRDPIDLEIHPDVRHVDGAIAMARTNDPNSATSQFYICDGPQEFLNDNYAAFGVTLEGIEVVREISSVETTNWIGLDDWPVENVTINSVTILD
jgi:cyclophilin family peptidyl-prolyl cis-trans isomerase